MNQCDHPETCVKFCCRCFQNARKKAGLVTSVVYVNEKRARFVGTELRTEEQRGDKYLLSEIFPSFLAQKTAEHKKK